MPGLKEAVAAAMLATAPEAQAQQAHPTEQVSPEQQFVVELRTVLKGMQEKYEGYIKQFGGGNTLADSIKRIKETEALLTDSRYVQGARLLKESGAQLEHIVGVARPETIMNLAQLTIALSNIPNELKGHFVMTVDDIENQASKDYRRKGLLQTALLWEQKGDRLSYDRLSKVLDAEDAHPGAIQKLLAFEVASNRKLKAEDLLYQITYRKMPLSVLDNQPFLDGVNELLTAGIGQFWIFPDNDEAETRNRVIELVSDSEFRRAFVAMKDAGIQIRTSFFQDWSRELYAHPNFIKNMRVTKQYSSMSLDDYRRYPNTMRLENYEDFLRLIPASVSKWEVQPFIEKMAAEPLHWDTALRVAKKYEGNAAMLGILLNLSSVKILDQEYMAMFDAYAVERGTVVNERGPGTSGLVSRFTLDKRYLQAKTGFDLKGIARDLNSFLRIYNDPQATNVMKDILEPFRNHALTRIILRMNELHDDSAASRLEVLGEYDAQTLFGIMVVGGSDAFLSTFRLIYNGNGNQGDVLKHTFKNKVLKEYGSLYNFLQQTNPLKRDVSRLLEHLSQNDLIDSFLADLGTSDQQHEILTKYVFDIQQPLTETEAVTADDLISTTKNIQIRDFILDSFRRAVDGTVQVSPKSKAIAGVLIASFYRGKADIPNWAQKPLEEFGANFPEIKSYDTQSAFRDINGVMTNIQAHFFYDDRGPNKTEATWDGHHSFRNFIISLGGAVQWDSQTGAIQRITVGANVGLEDKVDYIIVRKRDARTNREVVIYANKPDRADSVVAEVQTKIMDTLKPQTVVHRGHSYHASKTIRLIQPSVTLVNLGSCGGAKNISEVLGKVPTAQVMATRNVGTMLVNDPLIRAIDASLLTQGQVDWSSMRTQMNTVFQRSGGVPNERWQSYLLPNQNRTAHLLAALKKVGTR